MEPADHPQMQGLSSRVKKTGIESNLQNAFGYLQGPCSPGLWQEQAYGPYGP